MLFLCQLLLNFQGAYALIQVRSLRYLYVYPRYIKFYIEAYREMWEDESKEVKDFK